ncbi:MAG: hypothetical protein L6R39_000411, partial [Caloplaca ligustica]
MIINILSFVLLATIVTCVPTSPPGQPSLRKRQSDANDGSPFSGDVSLLRTINGWRYAFGVGPLTWSQDMANAAANTGQLNEASSSMQHHNPSDAAEVIAPGSDTDMGQDLKGRSPFEISLISWLCENPGTTMKDACGVQRSIMN